MSKIQTFLHKLLLKSKLHSIKYKRVFVNLNDAKSIGILYDATDMQNISPIIEFASKMKDQQKRVSLLGFTMQDKFISTNNAALKNLTILTKKDLNWLKKPLGKEVNTFTEKSFDVLLNLYTKELLPLQYIAALSKARYRVGIYNKHSLYCNDLLIDIQEDKNINNLIDKITLSLTQKSHKNGK